MAADSPFDPFTPSAVSPTAPHAAVASPPTVTAYPITFTGTGSEYFRIWIVNLLLTIVTLGIYHPWAKVRKLRYFYGNTQLAGHTFDFHGSAKGMLRGYGLIAVLFGVYSVASKVSPVIALVTMALIAAIYPALVWAGQRFRLSQTSWRGLRFAFTGSLAGAYKALLLPALMLAAAIGLLVLVGQLMPEAASTPGVAGDGIPRRAVKRLDPPAYVLGLGGLALLVAAAAFPVLMASVKRYQHQHLALGSLRSQFSGGIGPFFGVYLRASLLTLGAIVGMGVVWVGMGSVWTDLGPGGGKVLPRQGWILLVMAIVLAFLAVVLIIPFLATPYVQARLQNLVWNGTMARPPSPPVRFESTLRLRTMLALGIKNWLLTALTFGLYGPFAAIATAKTRLEAVTVHAPTGLGTVTRSAELASKDATGEAAVDLFGVDIGL
jgi:uncharacterized membrane protein YjgN (DUF898 family)